MAGRQEERHAETVRYVSVTHCLTAVRSSAQIPSEFLYILLPRMSLRPEVTVERLAILFCGREFPVSVSARRLLVLTDSRGTPQCLQANSGKERLDSFLLHLFYIPSFYICFRFLPSTFVLDSFLLHLF